MCKCLGVCVLKWSDEVEWTVLRVYAAVAVRAGVYLM